LSNDHRPLSSGYNYAYSGSAFESSFSGMGIPQEHSRRLSRDLRRGGAVVTVRAGSRNSTAEAVLQRNNGVVRYESVSATSATEETLLGKRKSGSARRGVRRSSSRLSRKCSRRRRALAKSLVSQLEVDRWPRLCAGPFFASRRNNFSLHIALGLINAERRR
jgi:hypothetical protein